MANVTLKKLTKKFKDVIAVDDMGNESEISNIVCVDVCPEYELPNVFTPNSDSYNDLFVPKGTKDNKPANPNVESIDMTIFNRWGKIMYTTTNPLILWDGRNQESGQMCSDGVYFYVCDVYIRTLEGTEKVNLKGSVTIYGSPQ